MRHGDLFFQCFGLLVVTNVFLLLQRGKSMWSLGAGIIWDGEKQSTCQPMISNLVTVPVIHLLLSTAFWSGVYAQGWEMSLKKIGAPGRCLCLAPPPSYGTVPYYSFNDVTGKCKGFRRIWSLWLLTETSLHQGWRSLTPTAQRFS